MGVLMGFAVGYIVGNRASRDSIPQLLQAFKEIRESDEFKAASQGAVGMVTQFVGQAVSERSLADNPLVSAVAEQAKALIGRRLAA